MSHMLTCRLLLFRAWHLQGAAEADRLGATTAQRIMLGFLLRGISNLMAFRQVHICKEVDMRMHAGTLVQAHAWAGICPRMHAGKRSWGSTNSAERAALLCDMQGGAHMSGIRCTTALERDTTSALTAHASLRCWPAQLRIARTRACCCHRLRPAGLPSSTPLCCSSSPHVGVAEVAPSGGGGHCWHPRRALLISWGRA
jgi:hypothetical protein